MPEVEPTLDTSPESTLPAFITQAVPQEGEAPAETPPAPEQPKEEPLAEPDWLNRPIVEQPAPQQYQQQYQPQYIPVPVPQYIPQPQYPQQPAPQQPYTIEQFVQNPDLPVQIAEQRVMQKIAPMVQELQATRNRLQQLDDFGRRQHESNVATAFEQTRAAIKEQGFKGVFAKDPAFRNPVVQQRVDQAVRGYLARATEQAHVYGDFSGYQNATRPSVLNAILQWAKDEAGWQPGANQPVQYQGGTIESGRTQSQPTRPDLDEGLLDAAREMRVDPSVLAKRLEERKKMWGL